VNRKRTRVPILIWVFSLFLFGLFCFQAVSEYFSSSMILGVVLRENGSEVRVVAVHDDSPAKKAGIRADSTLKAINGHAIRSISDIPPC